MVSSGPGAGVRAVASIHTGCRHPPMAGAEGTGTCMRSRAGRWGRGAPGGLGGGVGKGRSGKSPGICLGHPGPGVPRRWAAKEMTDLGEDEWGAQARCS